MKVRDALKYTPPGEIPSKATRWAAGILGRTMEEWAFRSGLHEITPSRLPALVHPRSLTPADAAISVLKGMAEAGGMADSAFDIAREKHHEAMDILVRDADLLCERKFRVLGKELDYSSGIRWHYDPANDHEFDAGEFHARVRHSNPSGGYDIKYPWELSRLQHLPRLALACRLTGERKYLFALVDQAQDWIRSNPAGFGPNWACTMDIAIRAANLSYAFALVAERYIDADFAVELVSSLIAHGRFISGHLEWSDELTSNHYLADIAGLAILSCLMAPTVPEAEQWRSFARDELHSEIKEQVYPDGCDFEASTAYHRLVLELLLVPAIFLDRAGFPVDDSYREILRKMAAFTRDISLPDGSFPLIGDNDSGLLFSLQPRPVARIDYLQALASAYLDDPALKTPGLEASPEILWFLGSEAVHRFDSLSSTDRPLTASYPDGGVWCMRSRSGRDLLTFRLGSVGQEGNGGHAHNDQLAITIWFSGKPVVVDPGTAVYTSDPGKRNSYRATVSHATVSIGDFEQNRFVEGNPFALPQEVETKPAILRADEEYSLIKGTMSGYGKWSGDSVRITRRITHARNRRQFEIDDEAEVPEELKHQVVWNFPLAPGLAAVERGSGYLQVLDESGEMVAEVLFYPGWTVEFEKTMYAPEYGVEVPNITLRFRPPGDELRGKFIFRGALSTGGASDRA